MPSLDVKYSSDLNIDTKKFFKAVEEIIKARDEGTGACKARGYPTDQFQHSHCYIELALLTKDIRDAVWTQSLLDTLEELLKAELENASNGNQVAYGINITYATPNFRHGKIG